MSTKSIQYFIKNILQNSKLNREKFVKNKKTYSETIFKNKNRNNLIFTPFYISNADFYGIKKIKKCKINFDGLTFSSSLWLVKK
jgi:uridine kinase